jgi:hypothetical protein
MTSWNDLITAEPISVLDVMTEVVSGAFTGVFANSASFGIPPVGWIASPLIQTLPPACFAHASDSGLANNLALQWNFEHLTWNSSALLAPPLRDICFVRGGREWGTTFSFDFGADTYNDMQIGLLESAATRGDNAGSFPVITMNSHAFTGANNFQFTFLKFGRYSIGIQLIDHLNRWSMAKLDLIIVP